MLHNGSPSVDPDFFKVFEEKFNIVDTILLKHYDSDFNSLRKHLESIKKEVFEPTDRIIVIQFDTDYYVEGVGINLVNLFTVWQEVDIPLNVMLFYTCNLGITGEINRLCRHAYPTDRPTVVETFFNIGNYDPSRHVDSLGINEEQIKYHGLTLMGSNRSHRFALYNHLRHLADRLVLTIRGRL